MARERGSAYVPAPRPRAQSKAAGQGRGAWAPRAAPLMQPCRWDPGLSRSEPHGAGRHRAPAPQAALTARGSFLPCLYPASLRSPGFYTK